MTRVWQAAYPDQCGVCGLLGEPAICDNCWAEMDPLGDPAALYHYSRAAGEAVRRLKYFRCTGLAKPMADSLWERYRTSFAGYFDAVIPVPIHWTRRFLRGFNQAELLCESLPVGLVQPGWLQRVRATRKQVGLSMEQRFANLQGAFMAKPVVKGKRILLLDDVVTSGATFKTCREALREAGAEEVEILCFAGIPQPASREDLNLS